MQKQAIGFLVLLGVALAVCPANYNINNLVADSVSFSVNGSSSSSSQNFVYSFQQSFAGTPALALGIQDFSINSLVSNTHAVYPSSLSNSQVNFQFDYTPALWSKIKVNFFATTNPQIQLGYFKVDNIQTIGSCNCALAYANINSPFGASDNPVIRVFINGYDVASNNVQLSVSPTNLQGTKLTVKITVGTKTSLKRIWLSWLAFSPSAASFGSYGGQVSQSKYSGSVSNDISNSLYQTPYVFYGLNLISLSNSQPLDFSSSVDNNFVLTISASSLVNDFSLVYIALGVSPSKLCSTCGVSVFANSDSCVAACPAGTYAHTYKDGGVSCRVCSNKLGMTLVNGKCVIGSTTVSTVTTTTILTGASQASNYGQQSSQSTSQSSTSSASSAQSTKTQSSSASTSSSASSASSSVDKKVDVACPENAFFNGVECVCNVGFVYKNDKCRAADVSVSVPISIANNDKSSSTKTTQDASSSSSSSSSSVQTQVVDTPAPARPPIETPKSSSSDCGPDAYNNGLGICVCNQGRYFSNGNCLMGAPCGPNSKKADDGSCICDAGFKNYNGVCSKCPQGALWSSSSNQCIFVCGQNSAYSTAASACVCNPGYGVFGGSCQTCPDNYFISNGYCVTCPVNAAYNPKSKTCECSTGFFTNEWGICARKCGTNEVYDSKTQRCSCIDGLGKVNGVCQICPAGTTPTEDGSSCSKCNVNEVLVNGDCVCQQGYAYNSAQVCVICSSLDNGFLVNGFCAVCPGNMIAVNGECACPQGKTAQGSLCVSQCQDDEILDQSGNCFTCASNQVISNGACVCAPGYQLSDCGVCKLSCSSGQFPFQGACAVCPLNTIFNAAINGCSCPTGFYMDTYGVCQKLTLQPLNCPSGQYFDSNSGCQACSASCQTCKSANQCITCAQSGYSANSLGVCIPTCGDGVIVGTETCDTGSSYSAGCISCRTQAGYTCSGQPSVCRSNAPPPVTPTNPNSGTSADPVIPSSPPLTQSGKTNINSNNVFISLKTAQTFTFANPTEMQGFIKATFPSGAKPTVYCTQRNSPNLDVFDCLLIYPSGVPNSPFQVNFSFNFQGKSGQTIVKVNPLAAKSNSKVKA